MEGRALSWKGLRFVTELEPLVLSSESYQHQLEEFNSQILWKLVIELLLVPFKESVLCEFRTYEQAEYE